MPMKHLLPACTALLLFMCRPAAAQDSSPAGQNYARNPIWIAMMEDSTANYFEVQKAYSVYFRNHKLPEGEHDVIGEKREHDKKLSRRGIRRVNADNRLRVAVKKYVWWQQKMLPYVQPDGRILFPYQRLQLHAQQALQR